MIWKTLEPKGLKDEETAKDTAYNQQIKSIIADTQIRTYNLYNANLNELLKENNIDRTSFIKMEQAKKNKIVMQAMDKTKIDYANGLGYPVKTSIQAKNMIAYDQANKIQSIAREAIDNSISQQTPPKIKFIGFK